MFIKPTELTEFLLAEEKQTPHASGNFTALLTHIEYAGRIIASHIKMAGLADILSKTGETNASEEEVLKLDKYSNDLLLQTLSQAGEIYAIGSEELPDLLYVNREHGKYLVFVDPLDGSSNTNVDITVGTIFSIYKRGSSNLPKGSEQVASGYILYGTSVMFVYTVGHGVNGFTYDPSIGSFLLSHPNMRIPHTGHIYSINESRTHHFDKNLVDFIDSLKSKKGEDEVYTSRYIGSMVADVHRTLIKGGIFLYPADDLHPNGKLRLMIEVNPMSFLIEQAGGIVHSGTKHPFDITPESLHQRAPVVLGSPEQMNLYKKHLS